MSVKTLGLALASSCLFYSGADAAGLGKLTVLSALGQPLRAEIELTAISNDDAGNIVPKLASAEAYKQANVPFSGSLNSLKFSVEERGSRHFVLVTSAKSVNEPFIEILVELNSGSGKLIREYTVLLDPVEMQASNAPVSSSNGITVSTKPNTVQAAPTQSAPAQSTSMDQSAGSTPSNAKAVTVKPAAPDKNSAAAPESGGSYQIKSGDTLSKIANQYKPQGVSLEQMLVALQRTNSAAFIDNNMNLLRSGHILTIPSVSDIDSTNQSEAKKIVLAQSTDFNSYRNKFATQVEQAKPEKAVEPKKADAGKITAKVTEAPTPINSAPDKLKLSKALAQEAADKKALEEDKIAKQQALDAANKRVKELEANTAKLQNILDLKNKATASAATSVTTGANASASAARNSVVAPAASVSAATPTPLPTVAAAVAASKPVIKPRPKLVAPEPAPEPGVVDSIIKYLPYAAVLLAILGAVGLLANRRKKKSDSYDDESILTGSSIKTNSLFGSTGGQSVDTNNSVFNSNFAPSASQLDANEVDPVAEADVYIAYGRDEQAEEILKEALRTQPDRQAVRVKLLEIYAHRKDTRTFETVASELYGMTGGEGADWAQAASLGIIIDPQNPLYAGGHASDQSAVMGATTLPVESLDPEALLGNSLSQEMLDSISIKHDSGHALMMGDANDRTHRTDEIAGGLDFDLGLTTNPDADDDFSSTQSNDLSKPFTRDHISTDSAEIPTHELSNTFDIPTQHDFSKALEIPSTTSALAAKPVVEQESDGMDFAALDFDFDIPKSHVEEQLSAGTVPHHDDIPMHEPLSHEATHSEFVSPTASPSLDYDFSSIDLDLPTAAGRADGKLTAGTSSLASALPDFSPANGMDFGSPATAQVPHETAAEISEIEFSAEMATKLDLAVAYQEIGDKDGARELLEEVLKGGNQEQVIRAKAMMHELA